MGLDNAGFLSTISPAVTLHPSASRSEHGVKQAGDLNPNKKGSAEETSSNAGNTATGAAKSTAMEDIASPASNPSGTLPAEKESDRLHLDASPEQVKVQSPPCCRCPGSRKPSSERRQSASTYSRDCLEFSNRPLVHGCPERFSPGPHALLG